MDVVINLDDLRTARSMLMKPVGLVPTMGYLHAGHLSLVRRARLECASVVVSIFVNPAQFGPHEDLDNYPRDLQRDLDLLEQEGVDLVWTPTNEVMYPQAYQTWVTVEGVSQPLEGAMRPGHFRGVATVVAKLFHAVQPDKAFFGQKDAQQAIVIKQMAADLNMPLEIVVCPTVRQPNGLAVSSRNQYLTEQQKRYATYIYKALKKSKSLIKAGTTKSKTVIGEMKKILNQVPSIKIEYISIVDAETMQGLEKITGKVLIAVAVKIGSTRLIDNILVDVNSR